MNGGGAFLGGALGLVGIGLGLGVMSWGIGMVGKGMNEFFAGNR